MKVKAHKIFIIALLFILNWSYAQNIDSLKKVLNNLKLKPKSLQIDTLQIKLYVELTEIDETEKIDSYANPAIKLCEENLKNTSKGSSLYNFYLKQLSTALNNKGVLAIQNGLVKEALDYYNKSLSIKIEIKDSFGIASCLNNVGYIYDFKGEITTALDYYEKALIIKQKIKDKKGIASSFNNIGAIYKNLGDVPKALDYYHKSLKIQEEINNKDGSAYALHNIGAIYDDQHDWIMAISYYKKAQNIWEETHDKSGVSLSLNSQAEIYNIQGEHNKALECALKGFKIRQEINEPAAIAYSLNTLGYFYQCSGDKVKALDYYIQALKTREKLNDKQGIVYSLNSIAELLEKKGDLAEAKKYGERSYLLASELGYPENIKSIAHLLAYIYSKTGEYKKAYEMQLEFKQMADSINSQTNRKASLQKSFQYEYEKKVAADSVKGAEENNVSRAKLDATEASLKQEKTQRNVLYGGLFLLLVFAGFMFNRFQVTKKQKHIIELKEKETHKQNEIINEQKHLVEEKHKEITDSINYAERIQRSFLASDELLTSFLNEYFIFFQPKDIVSGDFYWASELNNKQFAIATADSTGHGVPGAIMSLLNITSLEKAIEHTNSPSEILNQTRKTIINRLKKDGSAEGGKDGMDCSLMVLDLANKKLNYSAANNPIWIIRNNSILEFAPDKMPVGKHDKDSISFTEHQVELETGDMIYALTDGLPDQFGGPKGKKFMYKQLKELLISIANKNTTEQKQELFSALNTWKGNFEQVDDILIIGIRV